MQAHETRGEAYAFGLFRLDVGERTLVRGGTPVAMRAKVFDTLVELLRRPGRLVTRQELIDAVWPDSIVEEGNLSHNVSALRKALRDGEGGASYIETVPRRGYRFVHTLEEAAPAAAPAEDALARARRFLEQGAWHEAYRLLSQADARRALSGADLLALAEAARWSGRHDELVPLLERAVEAHRGENDPVGAAHAALELATVLYDRGRPTLSASYVRQAERALPADPPSIGPAAREHARRARILGRLRWSEGDWDAALDWSRRAARESHAAGDHDTEAMALMDAAHSAVALDRFELAAELLEEAGAVLTSGEVGPYAAGLTQCGIIWAWRACGRWNRAAEWADMASRWADDSGVAYFPGLCRVHRGELTCRRGELEQAEHDLARGTHELATAGVAVVGPALRELGSVRLRRGNLAGAQEAFQRALEVGTDPQPGLALLRVARGELEPAFRDLERFLSAAGGAERNLHDRENRFAALAAFVTLALTMDERETARGALTELERIAAATGAVSHRATAERAAGELALAEGRIADAVALLRASWHAWSETDAPFETAEARALLGEALLAEGDSTRARMELEGAAAAFERLGAKLEHRRVVERLEALIAPSPELPARLVACGEISRSQDLASLLGEEAWRELVAWLERKLTRCWRDHGGRTLYAASGRYAVAFDRLDTCLSCVTVIQASLREHRAHHGFAPELKLAIADGSVVDGKADEATLEALARELSERSAPGEVTLAIHGDSTPSKEELDRLGAAGVRVRLVRVRDEEM